MKIHPKFATVAVVGLLLAACGGAEDTSTSAPAAPAPVESPTEPAGADSTFPTQTIRFILPYSAGGPTDLGVRALAPCMATELGGDIVVENRAGAGGATAKNRVLGALPDGHTLGVGTQSTLVTTPVVTPGAGYEYTDFDFLGQFMEFPSAIMVAADSPIQTMEELLAINRDVTFGTSGSQVSFSLAVRQLADQGFPWVVVPFDGTAEANTAALGGSIDARWEGLSSGILGQIQDGQFRALAVGTPERLDYLPDIPTIGEFGLTGVIETTTFFAVFTPAGVPDDVRAQLSEALETCVKNDAEVRRLVGEERSVYLGESAISDRLSGIFRDVTELLG